MKLKIILIFLLIIILIILLLKKNTFEYLEYSYNDYEKTLKNINDAFSKYSEFSTLLNDKDYIDAIFNFKLLYDFNTSIIFDLKNKQEILYCMIPPDEKNLCRGFRILNNQKFDDIRLTQKLEYTKATIDKAINGRLNIIINKYNDKNIINIQNTFTKQLKYIVSSIYTNLKISN